MVLNILFDHNGNFMWSSLATLASFIAACLAYRSSSKNSKIQKEIAQQQIDANLKAKARIEWITEVRNLVSKYLSYLFDIKILVSRMQDIEEELSGLEKKMNQEPTYINRQKELKIKQLKKEEELDRKSVV